MPSIAEREALPFEGPAPPPAVRNRKTYVTLERAIKYGKAIGCKGCDRIAEGIPHSDACHERFRTLLQEDRMAKEASARGSSVPDTPAPDTPVGAPRTPAMPSLEQDVSRTCAPHPQNSMEVEAFFASCHAAPGEQDHGRSSDDSNPGDFWEYNDLKSAWKMNHVRPRKRLYAPVGKDCPFSVLMKSVHNVSQNGNAKVLFRFIKIIGKYIHTKGFLLKVGLGRHGFSQIKG